MKSRDRPPRRDVRSRSRGSSSGTSRAAPLRHRRPMRTNTGLCLDVPYVARPATVLGDDPEDAVVEAVGNRVASRPPGLAAGRLQDRSARDRKPETKQPADDGIKHVLRRPAGKPRFVSRRLGTSSQPIAPVPRWLPLQTAWIRALGCAYPLRECEQRDTRMKPASITAPSRHERAEPRRWPRF